MKVPVHKGRDCKRQLLFPAGFAVGAIGYNTTGHTDIFALQIVNDVKKLPKPVSLVTSFDFTAVDVDICNSRQRTLPDQSVQFVWSNP